MYCVFFQDRKGDCGINVAERMIWEGWSWEAKEISGDN